MENLAERKRCLLVQTWENILETFDIRKEDMNKLVMNFLIRECYGEVAETFIQESGNKFEGINLEEVRDRAELKRLILSGQADNAMYSIQKDKQQIAFNPKVNFQLAKQVMIEYIRVGEVQKALDFGWSFFPKHVAKYPHTLREFERVCTLLAFEDPLNCPLGELMGVPHRLMTAKVVNDSLLSREGYKKECSLDYMLKMMLMVQDETRCDGDLESLTINLLTRTYGDPAEIDADDSITD